MKTRRISLKRRHTKKNNKLIKSTKLCNMCGKKLTKRNLYMKGG